jgi:hypothetical protein
MESTIARNEIARYVSNLKLKRPPRPFEIIRTKSAVQPAMVKEGEEQAFISDKSLVSFVSGVKAGNRKDILNSTLLAQLAANKKHSLETDMTEWYKAFIEVLNRIGWVVEEGGMNTFEAKENLFEVENAIIDILTDAFGGNYIAIIKSALGSIKKMSESGDGKMSVFEKNTHSLSKGCFQVALAVEENDVVSMQLGTFLLTSSNEIKKILFVKFTKDKTKLEYSSRRATFNPDVYAAARQAISDKLSQDITDYVAEIEI